MTTNKYITLTAKVGDTKSPKVGLEHFSVQNDKNNTKLIESLGFLANYNGHECQRVIHTQIKHFNRFLHDTGLSLNCINQAVINLYSHKLRESGVSNSTYNLRLHSVKKYLTHAGYSEIRIKTAKITPYNNIKIINKNDFKNILAKLEYLKNQPGKKQIKYLRDSIIFQLLFYTGVRKKELLQLRWNHLFFNDDKLCFKTMGKGQKEVIKVLPVEILDDLFLLKKQEQKGQEDFIFTSQRINSQGMLSHTALNQILNYYQKAFNGQNRRLSVHGLRNLSSKVLYEKTKDVRLVQKHLGHANSNTTDHYLGAYDKRSSDHYNAMQEALNE